jgi:sacsin
VTPTLVASAYREVQLAIGLRWEAKMKLLRYLLKQSKFELLDGLELLPLANGGFDLFHFNPKKAERLIYIVPSSELQQLLPGLKDDFLEMDIDEDIKTMLTKAAMRGKLSLVSCISCKLSLGLVSILIASCYNAAVAAVADGISVFWNQVQSTHFEFYVL